MKQEVKIGQTDYTVLILIRDTAGAPKTGLTNASAGIDVCYHRVETDNDVVLTDAALVALATPALTDVHLDWGFLEVSSTKAPGLYRLDIADGVFATGAWSAVVSIIATGIDPCQIEFILVPELPYNGVDVYSIRGTAQTANDNGADINDILTDTGTTLQADTTEILTRIPDATAGANGGLTICGSNAATTYATLTVTGATTLTGNVALADGLTVAAPSTADRAGITITGNGTGSGIKSTGGATNGNGMTLIGGATNGLGLYAQGTGSGTGIRGDGGGTGHGIYGVGSGNGHGMVLTGAGTGHGIQAGGGATGHGINAAGGATSGDGIHAEASTSGDGLDLVGKGAGAGLSAYGGLTGNGVSAVGGGTSGDGVYAKAAGTGHGLACHGGGVAGDGLYAIADNDGDGVTAVAAGALQYDINADIHGTIDAVTTLTTYTGNTPQTGDSFAIVNGAHGLVSIQDDIDEILIDTGTTLDTLVKDIPTTAEFELRTLVAADYTIVTDLGVVQTADHTAAITAIDGIVDAILVDTGTTLDGNINLIEDIVRNKLAITDATGAAVLYEDNSVTPKFTVGGLITDDATTTTRLRLE